MRDIRRLTQILFASGALNIILIALVVYGLFGDGFLLLRNTPTTRPWQKFTRSTEAGRTNGEALRAFISMPLEQLIAQLPNKQMVEDGYTERDLALGCLVTLHYFDLDRALSGMPLLEARKLVLSLGPEASQRFEVRVHPGLSEAQYERIIHFAATERWPLTPEGLFLHLKQPRFQSDTSLREAFILTPEFLTLQRLFARSESPIDKNDLLQMTLDGDWPLLSAIATQLNGAQDFSQPTRQKVLVDYLRAQSPAAGRLLLAYEVTFAARKLDDASLILMLRLIGDQQPAVERFATDLLSSPRSDAVWQEARKYTTQPAMSVAASAPAAKPKAVAMPKKATKVAIATPPPAKTTKTYLVKKGDNLWRIAHTFNVDVSRLKSLNHLSSEILTPGSTLRIP